MAYRSGPYFCPFQMTRAFPSASTKRSTGSEFGFVLGISSPFPSADQSTFDSRGQSFKTTSRTTPLGSDINRIRPSCPPILTIASSEPSGDRLQFTPSPVAVILVTSLPFPCSGSKGKERCSARHLSAEQTQPRGDSSALNV